MPTLYDKYPLVLAALDIFSQGQTVTEACDEVGVSVAIFKSAIQGDEELQTIYAEAEARSYDAMADALINIDNHKIHGQSDSKMAKVISDNIKWVLERRDSKRFGQKVEVKHELTMDKAITSALAAARNRVPAVPAPDVVENVPYAEVVEDDDALLREMLR